jgi:two-component system, LuxR family, response regulator FixJ
VKGTVYIVDDDADVRDALTRVLEGHGLRAKAYDSAEAFLSAVTAVQRGCLLLDVRLPQMTGPQLQSVLNARRIQLPIIFLSGHADVSTAVAALRAGAFHFLEKPFDAKLLLESVRAALAHEVKRRRAESKRRRLRVRSSRLTAREQDVMNLVVAGLSNKDIGHRLNISHRTVEVHRSRVMQKMRAPSLLALVDYANTLSMERADAGALRPPESAVVEVEPEI